jgi:hypothetical protein
MERASVEDLDSLSVDIYGTLAKHNINYYETFLILIATSASIGNDAHISEEDMVHFLKTAIAEDKKLQHLGLQ